MSKKYDIFISHAKEDNKLAVALCHFLEERRLRCWMAPRDVQAGLDYAKCIIDGIQSSSIMVVILSEYSNQSNHVRNEVERAFNHQVAILPFRIRDVIPEQSLEYFLSSYHWLDAIEGQAENYFEDLYRHCSALLRLDSPPPIPPKPIPGPTPVPKPVPPTPVDPFYKKPAAIIFGAIILALLIFFFVIKPMFDKNAIEFKNNTNTSIYINLEGKTDTIKPFESFNYKGRKNSRVKTTAYTYLLSTTGVMLGRRLEWAIDTLVHADGNFTYPLNVASDYFFLKVINNSNADISYVYVNDFYPDFKDETKIKIPNDGRIYYMGYYKIYPNTTVQIWNTNNYWLKWTNGSSLTFDSNYNQEKTLTYKVADSN